MSSPHSFNTVGQVKGQDHGKYSCSIKPNKIDKLVLDQDLNDG